MPLDVEQGSNISSTGLEFPTLSSLIEFSVNRLLLSQRLFVFSNAQTTLDIGGVGTGKTLELAVRAILLAYNRPKDYGLIGRATATSLVSTTQKDFFAALPKEMNLGYKGEPENTLTIASKEQGNPSYIVFKHLRPSVIGHHHLSGYNFGWYSCDQLEDVEANEWDYLATRIRRQSGRGLSFALANSNGVDWMYTRYVKPAEDAGKRQTVMVPSLLGGETPVDTWRLPGSLVIRSHTHENVHLPKEFLENILRNHSREYIERYVECSFANWGGRIYKEFAPDSVHVIEPFRIPEHWPTVVAIDTGGDVPWAVLFLRLEPVTGTVYCVQEVYQRDLLLHDVEKAIKDYPSYGAGGMFRIICDPANRAVVTHFNRQGSGLLIEGAKKGPGSKVPGILHVADYMRRRPGHVRVIPNQPDHMGGFADRIIDNAPRLFFFKTCENTIREHAQWQWGRDLRTNLATNKPQDKDDHTCDALIYGLGIMPPVSKLAEVDSQLEYLRIMDPMSYTAEVSRREKMDFDKRTGNLDEAWAEARETFEGRMKQSDPWW